MFLARWFSPENFHTHIMVVITEENHRYVGSAFWVLVLTHPFLGLSAPSQPNVLLLSTFKSLSVSLSLYLVFATVNSISDKISLFFLLYSHKLEYNSISDKISFSLLFSHKLELPSYFLMSFFLLERLEMILIFK